MSPMFLRDRSQNCSRERVGAPPKKTSPQKKSAFVSLAAPAPLSILDPFSPASFGNYKHLECVMWWGVRLDSLRPFQKNHATQLMLSMSRFLNAAAQIWGLKKPFKSKGIPKTFEEYSEQLGSSIHTRKAGIQKMKSVCESSRRRAQPNFTDKLGKRHSWQ